MWPKARYLVCHRLDIMNAGRRRPYRPAFRPSRLDRQAFISVFGSVFEHSPWVAEQAYDGERGPALDTPTGRIQPFVFSSAWLR